MSQNSQHRALIEQVKEGRASPGAVAQLLSEFQKGLSLENLRVLLRSVNPSTVRDAVWILSELGSQARPLVDECEQLLLNEDKDVRFDVLDVVLVNGTSENGDLIAKALQLLCDHESAVVWKSIGFTRRLSTGQLQAALESGYLGELKPFLTWLLERERDRSVEKIREWAQMAAKLHRSFGAIAAARGGLSFVPTLQFLAETANDAAGRFARDELEDLLLSPRNPTQH